MGNTADQSLTDVLAFLVTFVAVGGGLGLIFSRLGRSIPDLRIAKPLAVAYLVRVLMAGAVSLTSYGTTLRGGDEEGFLFFGRVLADTPLSSPDWTDALLYQVWVFAVGVQEYLLQSPELALRVTQAGVAVAGLAFLCAAVHQLAGPRGGMIAAWILALEPTNVFFSTLVHKESWIILATGLVAFGGALMWVRPRVAAVLPLLLGCLVAAMTRGYASWFLAAAAALITLHSVLRAGDRNPTQAIILAAVVVIAITIAVPKVANITSEETLSRELQNSQNANASDQSNLSLERVDFSNRGALVTNLPIRVRDVLLRPYPWEVGNLSQQLGLLGTTVMYLLLGGLFASVIRDPANLMARAGPLVYITVFLLITYSLAAGNAGTAFRYRTHIVMAMVCVLAALRARHQSDGEMETRATTLVRWRGLDRPK